jgi:hypothetical protein
MLDSVDADHWRHSRQARLSADRRLHHCVKGRCGSVISALVSLRELLGPHLKHELPEEVQNLLIAPVAHLQEVIDWCRWRQVFVQLEEGVYTAQLTAVDLPIMIRGLAPPDSDISADAVMIELDDAVLKIALEEVYSNALKFGTASSSIRTSARLVDNMLHVRVENAHVCCVAPLRPEECAGVFQPGYKTHQCSAMSDGIGLDSVALAVRAIGGSVALECNAAATTASLSIPAKLCAPPNDRSSLTESVGSDWSTTHSDSMETCGGYVSASSSLSQAGNSVAWVNGQTSCGQGGAIHRERVSLSSHGPPHGCISSQATPPIRVIGFADCLEVEAMSELCATHIHADMRNAVYGVSPSDVDGLVNMVLRQPLPAEVILVSHSLSAAGGAGRPTPGTDVAQQLRGRCFNGLIYLFGTRMNDLHCQDALMHPAIDGVLRPGPRAAAGLMEKLRGTQSPTRKPGRNSAEFSSADTEACLEDVEEREAFLSEAAQPMPTCAEKPLPPAMSPEGSRCVLDGLAAPSRTRPGLRRAPACKFGARSHPLPHLSPLEGQIAPPPDVVIPKSPSAPKPALRPRKSIGLAPIMAVPPTPKAPLMPATSVSSRKSIGLASMAAVPLPPKAPSVPVTPLTPRMSVGLTPAPAVPLTPKASSVPVTPLPPRMSVDLTPTPAVPTELLPASTPTAAPQDAPAGSSQQAPAALRVVGLDDEHIPRMIQGMFMKHHLKANLDASVVLGKTEEEMDAFVDVALGLLNPDLSPNTGEIHQADMVLLDQNIAPPRVLGSLLGRCANAASPASRSCSPAPRAATPNSCARCPGLTSSLTRGSPYPKWRSRSGSSLPARHSVRRADLAWLVGPRWPRRPPSCASQISGELYPVAS